MYKIRAKYREHFITEERRQFCLPNLLRGIAETKCTVLASCFEVGANQTVRVLFTVINVFCHPVVAVHVFHRCEPSTIAELT
jgi:hypothetical protein